MLTEVSISAILATEPSKKLSLIDKLSNLFNQHDLLCD
jgi:hypothetical protein